jgi:hypothetical protein
VRKAKKLHAKCHKREGFSGEDRLAIAKPVPEMLAFEGGQRKPVASPEPAWADGGLVSIFIY